MYVDRDAGDGDVACNGDDDDDDDDGWRARAHCPLRMRVCMSWVRAWCVFVCVCVCVSLSLSLSLCVYFSISATRRAWRHRAARRRYIATRSPADCHSRREIATTGKKRSSRSKRNGAERNGRGRKSRGGDDPAIQRLSDGNDDESGAARESESRRERKKERKKEREGGAAWCFVTDTTTVPCHEYRAVSTLHLFSPRVSRVNVDGWKRWRKTGASDATLLLWRHARTNPRLVPLVKRLTTPRRATTSAAAPRTMIPNGRGERVAAPIGGTAVLSRNSTVSIAIHRRPLLRGLRRPTGPPPHRVTCIENTRRRPNVAEASRSRFNIKCTTLCGRMPHVRPTPSLRRARRRTDRLVYISHSFTRTSHRIASRCRPWIFLWATKV